MIDLSVVWWVVKVLFPCSKFSLLFVFTDFILLIVQQQKRERNEGGVFGTAGIKMVGGLDRRLVSRGAVILEAKSLFQLKFFPLWRY